MNSVLQAIQPSATLAISARAKELAAQGASVCNFAAGEPDFDTPDVIKRAAIAAIEAGKTKYTAAKGMPELCRAVAEKFARVNGIAYDPATEILVSSGGKQSLFYAFLALLERGDEVLIPSPAWLSYPELVRVAGGRPRFVKTTARTGYKLTPAQLEKAIRPRTKVLVLNYPSNPTGAVYSAAELRALGEVAAARGLWIVADEMYERMVYTDEPFASLASLSPAFRERADRIYKLLKKIPGVRVAKPEGAFYIFPNVKSFGLGSVDFCHRLVQEKHVAAVPGLPFGDDGCIRFSYACSMDCIEEGMARFADFCASLRK